MANILIQSAIPSLLSNTDSAANLIVDTPTENSQTNNNKYNGHVTRLRNAYTEHSLMANKLNSDDHPLIANGHRATNYHETKEIFPTSTEKSTCNNASLISTKAMANHRQEHSHDSSMQTISASTNRSCDVAPNSTDDVSYAVINRRYSNAEQHYDFPADAIEQLKKQQQREENDSTHHPSKFSDEPITTRFVPFNSLKRMDRLNTVFVKPTKIQQSLPKLVFEDREQSKSPENMIFHENDYAQIGDRSSSPLFFEKPGLPEVLDDTVSNDTRRVRFSSAPMRVYPTYSPGEYDRRNEDIDPFSAAAEYELEKRIEKMNVFSVEVEKGPDGLGISVLGMGVGADSGLEKLGIFVKSLNPQGIIAKDGRIQVGDQIIEVNEQSLVGVTHSCATNVLKTTSGLVKFIIGREKEPEKSEIFTLIQRSLQLDQQREDISETFQQYHDAYYEQNFNDQEQPMDEKMSNEFEVEILKQCYESLERTLDSTEKEKEHYQQLYQQAQNDLKQIEEKYLQATVLVKELQDRDTQLRQQHTDISEQQERRIQELMNKVGELEKVIATAAPKSEHKISSLKATEFTTSYPSDGSERTTFRTRSSSGQQLISSSRNPVTMSSVRIPALSLERILTRSHQDSEPWQISSNNNNKSSDQLDQSSSINRTHTPKPYTITVPSMHVSNPSLGGSSNDSNINDMKISASKGSSMEKTSYSGISSDEYVEIKDWTTDRCLQWLTAQKMTSLIPVFLNRNIDGEKLLTLDGSKMKAMGIKSSKDRDQLKTKIKELKSVELNQLRERLTAQSSSSYRSERSEKKLRSSSLTKLKERRFFSSSFGK